MHRSAADARGASEQDRLRVALRAIIAPKPCACCAGGGKRGGCSMLNATERFTSALAQAADATDERIQACNAPIQAPAANKRSITDHGDRFESSKDMRHLLCIAA
jgi:hypothetical protein